MCELRKIAYKLLGLIGFTSLLLLGLARPWDWPCPAHRFSIIGDSNVQSWRLGPGCQNLGVSGDTSKRMAARFNPDEIATPVLVIWGSTNDVHYRTGDATRYMREMALKARARGIKVILTTPIPLHEPARSQAEVDAAIRALGDEIRQLGASEGLPVADVHSALVTPAGEMNLMFYRPNDDKPPTIEHLNRDGHLAVWAVLEPLIH